MEKLSSGPAVGLIASLTSIARNTLGLLLSRLELAALELSEVRNQILKIAVVFTLAIVAIWFAVAYASAMIVILAWASLGWKILLVMTGGFSLLAAGLLLYLRAILRQGKLSLASTMQELQTDRDMLL
ncbi:hypothetical protein BH11PSE12_BH11PSE12_00390 [soil metagenome]